MDSLSSDEKRALLKKILEQKTERPGSRESDKKPHERLIETLSAALSDRKFSEYGLDSIEMVQLEAELGHLYGVQISPSEWAKLKTIKDLTLLLALKQSASISGPSGNFLKKAEDETTWKVLLKENPGLFFWPSLNFVLWRIWPLRARGVENIPRNGPFILSSNHSSHFDTLAIISCLSLKQRRELRVFSARQNFDSRVLRFFLKRMGGIAVDRSSYDQRMTLKTGEKILKGDKILLSYPEGTRSRDGRLNEFRNGNAYLSLKTGAPILPAYIKGAHKILPPLKTAPRFLNKRFNRLKIKLVFGEPIYPRTYDSETDLTKELRRRIINLGESIE